METSARARVPRRMWPLTNSLAGPRFSACGRVWRHASSSARLPWNARHSYKGIMNLADYKKKRIEVMEDPEEAKREKLMNARQADAAQRERDAKERAAREQQRRDKLKAELRHDDDDEAAASEEATGPPKKKKKKKAAGATLSFDTED